MKCTYGNKCKFRHPERGVHSQKSVTEKLVVHVNKHFHARGSSPNHILPSSVSASISQHHPLCETKSTVITRVQSLLPVTKSKSVENITIEQPINVGAHGSQVPPTTCSQGYNTSMWTAGRLNKPDVEPPNMHRKLQRQLTLNPVSDPRLCQLRQYQLKSHTNSVSQQSAVTSSGAQHRPLARHSSNESPHRVGMKWDHSEKRHCHQHVTRIASAPVSYQTWLLNNSNIGSPSESNPRLGASDPQLNLDAPALCSSMSSDMLREFLDTRTKIHYHLANIFPEEHVRAAMLIHPYVTDPIEICVAVLKMHPQ